jgi:hypothetical protein
MPLKAVAFNCTLKPHKESSSTELLIMQILGAMTQYAKHESGWRRRATANHMLV